MHLKDGKLYSYEVHRDGGEDVLYINYLVASFVPDIADSPEVMARTIDALIENPNVSRVVFVQQKNYNYDLTETNFLLEVAQLYVYLIRQEKILSQEKLVTTSPQFFSIRYNSLFSFLYLLKQDPIASYFELKKILIEAKVDLEKIETSLKIDQGNYIRFLEKILGFMEQLKLIKEFLPYFSGYKKGSREIYHKFFKPDIIPNFTFTPLVANLP